MLKHDSFEMRYDVEEESLQSDRGNEEEQWCWMLITLKFKALSFDFHVISKQSHSTLD